MQTHCNNGASMAEDVCSLTKIAGHLDPNSLVRNSFHDVTEYTQLILLSVFHRKQYQVEVRPLGSQHNHKLKNLILYHLGIAGLAYVGEDEIRMTTAPSALNACQTEYGIR